MTPVSLKRCFRRCIIGAPEQQRSDTLGILHPAPRSQQYLARCGNCQAVFYVVRDSIENIQNSAGLAQLLHQHFVVVFNASFRTEVIAHLCNLLLRPLHRRQLTVELLHQFQIERLAPDSVKVNVPIGP